MSYGKIKESFWTSKTVLSFSDDAKLLALYFLSGPHRNILGCMRVPNGYIVEDLKWTPERLRDAIAMLCEKHWLRRDDDGWTLICNQLEHDPLKVPNHARAAIALAGEVPLESPIYQALVEKLSANLKAIGMASEWHPKGRLIPEPLPEPSPEPSPEPPTPSAPVGSASPSASPAAPTAAKPPAKAKGTRLRSDWEIPQVSRDWASERLVSTGASAGTIAAWITTTAEGFKDHWLQSSKPTAVKQDWQAAWRVWVRKELADGRGPKPTPGEAPAVSSQPPEKRLRDATIEERELARRVRKVCGNLTTDAEVAEWRRLDAERPAPPDPATGEMPPIPKFLLRQPAPATGEAA